MAQNPQEAAHPLDFDYQEGSPHLKHPQLRARVERSLTAAVEDQIAANGTCRVLEVGAGHGEFSQQMSAAGAEVTVTEMSKPSADQISQRYANNPSIKVVYDPDANWIHNTDERFDMVAAISVLHHIPDYAEFLRVVVSLVVGGGTFVSWQDPTWYPRRDSATSNAEKGFYYLWRIQQGDLIRGLKTRARRIRGIYDESNIADMSEYHVVRKGVDEFELNNIANQYFDEVELVYYWSTQSTLGQRIGDKRNYPNTFALIARSRNSEPGKVKA